jgi:hypothetical protein
LDATAAAAAAITTTDAPGDRRLRADNNSSSSSVFIKMINRHSDEYKSIGRLVNPHHTELAMLQSGQAKHLPQFVEHFWDPDYLVIVTRKHGLPRPRNRLREWLGHLWRFLVSSNSESNDIATSKANAKKTCAATTNALYGAATPSDPRYYPVEWIYYFSHIA